MTGGLCHSVSFGVSRRSMQLGFGGGLRAAAAFRTEEERVPPCVFVCPPGDGVKTYFSLNRHHCGARIRRTKRSLLMPMELLRELAHTPLPCTLGDEKDIDRLRVLRAAGYIAAMLPMPGSQSRLGRVLAITPEGREALARAAPESVDRGFARHADGVNERRPVQTT